MIGLRLFVESIEWFRWLWTNRWYVCIAVLDFASGIRVWSMISCAVTLHVYYNGDGCSALNFVESFVLRKQRVRCSAVVWFNLSRAPNPFTISPSLRVKIYYNADDRSALIFIESMEQCRWPWTIRLSLLPCWSFGLLFFLLNRWRRTCVCTRVHLTLEQFSQFDAVWSHNLALPHSLLKYVDATMPLNLHDEPVRLYCCVINF